MVTGAAIPRGSNTLDNSCSNSLLVVSKVPDVDGPLEDRDRWSETGFQKIPRMLLGVAVSAVFSCVMAQSCGLLVTQALKLK